MKDSARFLAGLLYHENKIAAIRGSEKANIEELHEELEFGSIVTVLCPELLLPQKMSGAKKFGN